MEPNVFGGEFWDLVWKVSSNSFLPFIYIYIYLCIYICIYICVCMYIYALSIFKLCYVQCHCLCYVEFYCLSAV